MKVENGIATEIEPNFDAEHVHPARAALREGLRPSSRRPTIPTGSDADEAHRSKKGMKEDPGFTPISWDEALDIIAGRLRAVSRKGAIDEAGLPRVAAS